MSRPSPRKSAAPSLAEIQRTIVATLGRPLMRDESMSPDSADVAERLIKPNDRLTSFERLQIYNQQYWWRLLGSVQEDFRGLRGVLGERKFERLAEAYLAEHGSTSWSLANIGFGLPDFIQKHPDLGGTKAALAFDVVRVECARIVAFEGLQKPVIGPARIAKTPPDRLRLGLQPYITLLELSHPVDEFMRKLKSTRSAAVSNAVSSSHTRNRSLVSVLRSRKPIHLAVHRVDYSVYYKRLDAEAYAILCALRDGSTLEAACAAAFAGAKERPEQSAARIQEWFSRWMEFGWFCAPARV